MKISFCTTSVNENARLNFLWETVDDSGSGRIAESYIIDGRSWDWFHAKIQTFDFVIFAFHGRFQVYLYSAIFS